MLLMFVPVLSWAHHAPCQWRRVIRSRQIIELPHGELHGRRHDGFGESISISGSTAVVGAMGLDRAFVYQLVKGIWIQEQVLRPEGPSESFGSEVAISGTTIVVTDPLIYHMNGAAFVFRRDGNRWIQVKVLRPPPGGWLDHFGVFDNGLALYRNTVYVTGGKPVGNHRRYVWVIYVYEERNGHWTRTAIDARDLPKGSTLGPAIAVLGPRSLANGSVLASVRLKHAPWRLMRPTGQINILRLVHQKWVVSARLSANRPQKGGLLGYPLAASGNEIVATARDGIYVYRKKAGQWYHFWKIKPALHQGIFGRDNLLGSPVTVAVPWVAYVQPSTVRRNQKYYLGVVHLFRQQSRQLVAEAKLLPPPYTRQQRIHFSPLEGSVSLSGNWLAVGAKNVQTTEGLVYFYHLNPVISCYQGSGARLTLLGRKNRTRARAFTH